eukprot:7982387-Pyramimonas_sp.AAC.1
MGQHARLAQPTCPGRSGQQGRAVPSGMGGAHHWRRRITAMTLSATSVSVVQFGRYRTPRFSWPTTAC